MRFVYNCREYVFCVFFFFVFFWCFFGVFFFLVFFWRYNLHPSHHHIPTTTTTTTNNNNNTNNNNQTRNLTEFFNFRIECLRKYNREVYAMLMDLFDYLPLASVVTNKQGRFFCLHGGLSPSLQYIEEIDRFVYIYLCIYIYIYIYMYIYLCIYIYIYI